MAILQGWRVVLKGMNSVRLNGYAYIWGNLAFLLLSLPIITAPAAYSALVRVAHETQTQPSTADLGLFWETFRANFWRALPWGVANLAFVGITFSNFLAYNNVPGFTVYILRLAWLAASLGWWGVVLYTWTLFYEMENPSVWGATRNALVMTLKNPLFTLAVVLGVTLLSVISTVLTMLWILLTWSVIAAIGTAAVLDRLAEFRSSQEKYP
ncbi:MAG: DUF624 domain-containing protein [Chloroflexi bacterium]|nr:DUF624 domain-containing protein [Chloroflexota bacterium]